MKLFKISPQHNTDVKIYFKQKRKEKINNVIMSISPSKDIITRQLNSFNECWR